MADVSLQNELDKMALKNEARKAIVKDVTKKAVFIRTATYGSVLTGGGMLLFGKKRSTKQTGKKFLFAGGIIYVGSFLWVLGKAKEMTNG